MHHPPPQAAAQEWIELSGRLTRLARSLCRSADEAEDLTQETLARLLARQPERVGHIGYARATLVRVWVDRQRTWKRRLARLTEWSRVLPGVRIDADHASQAEQAAAARAAVERLPAQQRAVFVLRLIEELEYDEIADTLGCSVEAVRASLHLARRSVRRAIGEPE